MMDPESPLNDPIVIARGRHGQRIIREATARMLAGETYDPPRRHSHSDVHDDDIPSDDLIDIPDTIPDLPVTCPHCGESFLLSNE